MSPSNIERSPMKKPTRAMKAQAAKVAAAVAILEPYRDQEAAVWEHLPRAYEQAFGVPLNMADPHDLMLCQGIFNQLVKVSDCYQP